MKQDEIIATWTPSLWVFLGRSVFVGFVTFVVIGGFSIWLGVPVIVTPLILLVCIVFYMFVFDDFTLWNQHRNEVWTLSRSKLVLAENGQPEQTATLPLDRIMTIRRWFWWSLTIKLNNDMAVEMSFLPCAAHIRKTILKSKDELAC